MSKILINNKVYSYSDIQIGKHKPKTTDEYQVFKFIKAWLDGQMEFVVSTSGSTGKPKPITISRNQMILSAQKTGAFLGLKKGNTTLVCLSPDHIAGKMMLVRTLVLGLKATFITPSANPYKQLIGAYDLVALVPLQVQNILKNKISSQLFYKTKNILIGGAPLLYKLERKLSGATNQIYHTYGMTETVSHVALKNISKGEKTYKAIPGMLFSNDSRGCLKITNPMFNPKTLQTNDVITLISDTSFIWKGRADFIINTGGIKIQIEVLELQIQEILTSIDLSCDFFIFPQEDELLGQKVCLAITIKNFKLADLLKRSLPQFHNPKSIFVLNNFIYNKSGKLDRKACIEKIQS